jgi:hypothetical protein
MDLYFEIGVTKVSNGYLVTFWEEEEPEPVKIQCAFEEGDSEYGTIECFQRLLYYITEHFGMLGSKHDKRRIRITTGGEDADTLYPQRED